MRVSITLLCIALTAPIASAQGVFNTAAANITASAVPSQTNVAPGLGFTVAVVVTVNPDWVFYGPDPGDYARAGNLAVDAGDLKVLAVRWPPAHEKKTRSGDLWITNNVYEGRLVAYVPLEVPPGAKDGIRTIRVKIEGQICQSEGVCVPLENITAETSVTVGAISQVNVNPAWTADASLAEGIRNAKPQAGAATRSAATASAAREAPVIPPMEFVVYGQQQDFALWAGLALAVLAGVILNIMPCVLPVIPLKVMSIVQQAGQSRRRFVTMGLAFAGGVMLFFVALAAVNLLLKSLTGSAFDWGQQWQYASLRIAMAMLMVLVAANLFGLFNVTVSGKVAALGDSGGGHWGAAATGLLTGILATPCSFGILTAALAWAQSLSVLTGSLALLLIGVGMALPYAVLTAFPSLVARLPCPGRWMELFKQSMGFVMLLVAVWLLAAGGGDSHAFWAVGYGVVLAFCLWMWGSWVRYDEPLRRKIKIRGVALVLAAAAGVWMLWPPAPLHLKPFDWNEISNLRRQGKTVIVDMSASWCLTCKTVEARIYRSSEVAQQIRELDVKAYYGDITTVDLPANALKRALKNEPIPATVILTAPDKPAVVLRGLFTREELLGAIEFARKQK